ncbi:MAG: hypothetical protein BWY99_02572 [Synergistetes bacterium ADurb.BinA166]|nr:MAG: hypothetical protein BWY99_02572 [Synergistetes bacterium ADurb.BinA166]
MRISLSTVLVPPVVVTVGVMAGTAPSEIAIDSGSVTVSFSVKSNTMVALTVGSEAA